MIHFTAHEHDGEWVIRCQHENGYMSIGSMNGEIEARLIVDSLNCICFDGLVGSVDIDNIKNNWKEYIKG